jgi:hypothetical protein
MHRRSPETALPSNNLDQVGADEEVVADPDQIVTLDSKIVLSLSASDGGTPFDGWLYRRLSQHYHLPPATSVHFDPICSGIVPKVNVHQVVRKTTSSQTRLISDRPPIASVGNRLATKTVGLDTRDAMRTTTDPYLLSNHAMSTHPISTRRSDWDLLFKSAVRASQVMVILLNRQYPASLWCNYEVQIALDETNRRHRKLRPGLKLVVLTFDGVVADDAMIRQRIPHAKIVSVRRAEPVGVRMGRSILNAAHPWSISEDAFARLVAAISHFI